MSDYKYYTPIDLFVSLLDYLPSKNIKTIVDISCGSFNLLKAALVKFPQAKCTGVDVDSQNLSDSRKINFINQDGRLFAKSQQEQNISYDLILTNPPFGRLKENDRLFEKVEGAILCSRYECEMMYANTLLTHKKSQMIAILPASFVEGDMYFKYRRSIAEEYQVHFLIKLPGNVFSKGDINSYAIILSKATKKNRENTHVGLATKLNGKWIINKISSIDEKSICGGVWVGTNEYIHIPDKEKIDSIYRGNISSSCFSSSGERILHCSSIFENDMWKPSQKYCNVVQNQKRKYVFDGDIIINRIGKNAGFWMKYHGEKQLISDCLIVVHGGNNIEQYLAQHSQNGRLQIPTKGVATKYISMKDILTTYFELKQP